MCRMLIWTILFVIIEGRHGKWVRDGHLPGESVSSTPVNNIRERILFAYLVAMGYPQLQFVFSSAGYSACDLNHVREVLIDIAQGTQAKSGGPTSFYRNWYNTLRWSECVSTSTLGDQPSVNLWVFFVVALSDQAMQAKHLLSTRHKYITRWDLNLMEFTICVLADTCTFTK
jgi:hypothetical protein